MPIANDLICACGHWYHLHIDGICRTCGCTRVSSTRDIQASVTRTSVSFDLDAFERHLKRQQVIEVSDAEILIAVLRDAHAQLVQAREAAAHFSRCRTCQPGGPCPEGWAYVVALGLKGN